MKENAFKNRLKARVKKDKQFLQSYERKEEQLRLFRARKRRNKLQEQLLQTLQTKPPLFGEYKKWSFITLNEQFKCLATQWQIYNAIRELEIKGLVKVTRIHKTKAISRTNNNHTTSFLLLEAKENKRKVFA